MKHTLLSVYLLLFIVMSKGVRHPLINLTLEIPAEEKYLLILYDYMALQDTSVFTGIT